MNIIIKTARLKIHGQYNKYVEDNNIQQLFRKLITTVIDDVLMLKTYGLYFIPDCTCTAITSYDEPILKIIN